MSPAGDEVAAENLTELLWCKTGAGWETQTSCVQPDRRTKEFDVIQKGCATYRGNRSSRSMMQEWRDISLGSNASLFNIKCCQILSELCLFFFFFNFISVAMNSVQSGNNNYATRICTP